LVRFQELEDATVAKSTIRWQEHKDGCCHLTVDPGTQTSQKRFIYLFTYIYELTLHKKYTKIMSMTTNLNVLCYFYLLSWITAVVKQDHYITHLFSFVRTVLWCNHRKIHRYVAAPKDDWQCFFFIKKFIRETWRRQEWETERKERR
jgi:hypothetical protein